MSDEAEFISAFCAITNTTEDIARFYRLIRSQDLARAIDLFYDDGAPTFLTESQHEQLRAATRTQESEQPRQQAPPSPPPPPPPPPTAPTPAPAPARQDPQPQAEEEGENDADNDLLAALTALMTDLGEDGGSDEELNSSSSDGNAHGSNARGETCSDMNWVEPPVMLPPPQAKNCSKTPPSGIKVKIPPRAKRGQTMEIILYQDGITCNGQFSANGEKKAKEVIDGIERGVLNFGGDEVVDISVVDKRDIKHPQ